MLDLVSHTQKNSSIRVKWENRYASRVYPLSGLTWYNYINMHTNKMKNELKAEDDVLTEVGWTMAITTNEL